MTAAITDFSQFSRMRQNADAKDPAVLREVAGQFESLFLEILLKDMRSASLGNPLFGNSSQHDMYREMLDKQLAVEMSRDKGIGLADLLVRQLGGDDVSFDPSTTEIPLQTDTIARRYRPALPDPGIGRIAPADRTQDPVPASGPRVDWSDRRDFIRDVWPHAERAGRSLGIAPQLLLAQATLETGWGQHVMQRRDGSSSLNLFGIKAGSDWQSASVSRPTLEYRDGIAQKEMARFRAYPDLAAVFDDYAEFLTASPRYSAVLGSGDNASRFAEALQSAGYATDPEYATKIKRVAQSAELNELVEGVKKSPVLPKTPEMARTLGL